ncbi:MAG TPA: hypothetical protein V6C72_18920 [Chroococcales cyanobacterium]
MKLDGNFAGEDARRHDERSGLLIVLVWSLLPCAAIWIGVIKMRSAVWAYVLYHYVCLLPAIVCGRKLWSGTLTFPKAKHIALLGSAAFLFWHTGRLQAAGQPFPF